MTYKRYAQIIMLYTLLFIAAGMAIWYGTLRETFFGYGGLSRMCGRRLVVTKMDKTKTYEIKHTEFEQYLAGNQDEQFDIITIGSSSSNGGGGAYYQDYLTDTYGLKILNVPCGMFKQNEVLSALAAKGVLSRTKPRYVIVECVERHFPKITSWTAGVSEVEANHFMDIIIRHEVNAADKEADALLPSIMIKSCFKLLIDRIYSLLNTNRLSAEVYEADLNNEFFRNLLGKNKLYYYYEDRNYLDEAFDMKSVNASLNRLDEFIAQYDTKFVFLGIPNKLSVYLPYMTNPDDMPENESFVNLEAEEQNYIFVNVKDILSRALASEFIQDLFWGDGTHWSYKAHKFVGDYIAKTLFGMN